MAPKQLEERVGMTEQDVQEIKKELQRLPVLEQTMERMAMDLRETHHLLAKLIRELPQDKGKATMEGTEMEESEVHTKEKEGEEGDLLEEWEWGETSREGNRGDNRIEIKKMEMPVFNGEDPESWLFRAEHFFQLQSLTELEKLKLSVVSFEGEAIWWLRWSHNRKKIRTWEKLKRRMLWRFCSQQDGTQCARFLSVKQTATVADFRWRFEKLAAPLPHLAEEVLEGTFANGLEIAIRKEVLSLRPNGLEEMMDTAQLVEDRMEPGPEMVDRFRAKGTRHPLRVKEAGWAEKLPTGAITLADHVEPQARRREGGFQRLTEAELRSRREKGLCFKCDERYSVGHRYKNKELRLLLLTDEEEPAEGEEKGEPAGEEQVELEETVELTLNSVVGLNAPGTMKLKGLVDGREVVILIDCGATHNFINLKLVREVPLKVTDTTSYGVVMGTGQAVQGKGMCRGVAVSFQDFSVIEDFLPLELGHIDVILGMQWLWKQGQMSVDWKKLTMSFTAGDVVVTLRGDPSLTRKEISLKALTRTWEEEDQAFWVEMGQVRLEEEDKAPGKGSPEHTTGNGEIDGLLKTYGKVFEKQEGLSPQRIVDH